MSLFLGKLMMLATDPFALDRMEMLELRPVKEFKDGRTKQSHKDETDIVKIMARYDKTGTISHLAKHEGKYQDFSDFDFHKQMSMLARGREIFDDLPGELRKEFGQSPAAFFAYVNDPENVDILHEKLPGLAAPGQQLPRTASPDADLDAAEAARNAATGSGSEPVASETPPTDTPPVTE